MKKENFLMFTSIFGAVYLYNRLLYKTRGLEKRPLRNELAAKAGFTVMVGIMVPAGGILSITDSLSQSQELLKNIIHLFLLLWIYIVGMLIVKSLLKWKRERLDQWSELSSYTIGRRLP